MEFKNGRAKIEFKVVKKAEGARLYVTGISFNGQEFVRYNKGVEHTYLFLLGAVCRGKNFNRYAALGEDLFFVDATEINFEDKKQFIVEEKNNRVAVRTIYTLFNNSAMLSVKKEVTNLSKQNLTIECCSPLTLKGIMADYGVGQTLEPNVQKEDATTEIGEGASEFVAQEDLPIFWKAHNTWCCEAGFEPFDLLKEGMRCKERIKRCGKISVVGNGSQTTNRYLPLGIFEKSNYGYFLFELLPVGSWSYEIEAGAADYDDHEVALVLSGKTLCENGWFKALRQEETYCTEEVRIVGGKDLDDIAEDITVYRRNVKRKTEFNVAEQVIYNVFQQNCWANPSEEQDEKWIPIVAQAGADYYVIDAGWFDDGDTHAIGIWDECLKNYPSGLSKTLEKIRAKGMKVGLWVELQSVGMHCANKNLLPKHCFFHINGERPICNGRYQLNYALQEVRDYADGIIQKIVERYGVDYIKIDYNQTQIGNDYFGGNPVEGLAEHVRGYLKWYQEIQDKYPQIIFETCASGGLWMDSNIAAKTAVFSASDQGCYYNYPPILANLPFAVLPEQMGIWCVPVRASEYPNTTDEKIVINVINALYGVMHLSSKIDVLSEKQNALLAEGLSYYRELARIKSSAIPVFPKGFAYYDDEIVFTGFKTKERLYLSVYNMSSKDICVEQDLAKYNPVDVKLVYPSAATNTYSLKNGMLSCEMKTMTARAFEFKLRKE